jgi:hypothetical protein
MAPTGAASCECIDRRNYIAARKSAFPVDLRELLAALGVEWRKDAEVFALGDDGEYNPLFHFIGRLVGSD